MHNKDQCILYVLLELQVFLKEILFGVSEKVCLAPHLENSSKCLNINPYRVIPRLKGLHERNENNGADWRYLRQRRLSKFTSMLSNFDRTPL